MSRPEDFINWKYQDPINREIMLILHGLRGSKLTSAEIQELCKVSHLYASEERKYSIRSIEGWLQLLVKNGDVDEESSSTKQRGRPRKLFSISNKCKGELEEYVKKPIQAQMYRMGATKI
jgi:predicted ArsR family transcriptional regulator